MRKQLLLTSQVIRMLLCFGMGVLMVSFLSCKKDNNEEIDEPRGAVQVNFYQPSSLEEEYNKPQITIKDETFQLTAIGHNANGIPQRIEKIYLADEESMTEWMVILDDQGDPAFLYGVNTATNERLPDLYWYLKESSTVSYLRYYSYDWENRLGTLLYEVKTTNGSDEVTFGGDLNASLTPSMSVEPRLSSVAIAGEKKSKNNAFKTPAFDLMTRQLAVLPAGARGLVAASNGDETMDEAFDRQTRELLSSLQSLKDELFDKLCNVSELSGSGNAGCSILDVLKTVTDRQIFDDVVEAHHEHQEHSDPSVSEVYSGSMFNIDFGVFNASNIHDNLGRHFNDIWGSVQETDIERIFQTLEALAYTDTQDLDDLTDSRGVVHVALSWNSTSDIDLHVVDPFGERVFFQVPTSQSGGYLDRDDVDGYGPENIYWPDHAPDGTYVVYIHYYGVLNGSVPAPSTACQVKIVNGLGSSFAAQTDLWYVDQMTEITKITKQGNQLTFH
ncbi:YfaP family protein [Parapedobacter sp. DT-150]|uniref:YfaP family protein n=1 Tax=Parapedobacter sp. DT-150 TaxID=3396162 RepID=UPI003F1CF160